MKTAWLILLFAGVTEVTWAIAMKYSEGFTRLVPSVVTAVFYIASAVLLSVALHKLPLGTAYAIWTGMGIVGTTVLGVVLFHETLTPAHIVCLLMIAGGIVGVKMLT
ncbi:multidrug efflux SMR transporter [uncultured Selenomonas sp.]|uniref:DMT family transporter n=1 Tax=uncultured Selenomonas sp. TaxID=159275 RepID=UPI0025CC9A7B|nr:multidrug efflux SMR transporter [uncultured Selenomonas sp.]